VKNSEIGLSFNNPVNPLTNSVGENISVGISTSKSIRTRCKMAIIRASRVLTAALATVVSPLWAQQASSFVSLKAYLRPAVRLSDESVSFTFSPESADCREISLPFDISWNVDRFTKQIQVIAMFSNSQSALTDGQGHTIPASAVEARIGDSTWKTFPETRSHTAASGLLLTTINVLDFGRQAHQHTSLHFRLCQGQSALMQGEYHGRVELQAVTR